MNFISRALAIGSLLINTVVATDVSQTIFDNVITGIKQICLPDGKSLYGDSSTVMGESHFTLPRHKPIDTFLLTSQFTTALQNPRKTSANWFSFSTEYYTPAEIIDLYKKLTNEAAALDPNALLFFNILLRSGEISGVTLTGLKPQMERANLFGLLYKWRTNYALTDEEQEKLTAIRIERERLDGIDAEKEAKRKTEADAKSAEETARIADAESARLESAKKVPESSGLRRRKGHEATTIPGLDDDDRAAVVTTPLLTPHGKPVRAH